MNKKSFTTIAIITKNEEKYIAETINSVLNQDYPKNKYEILIIDGNSTDKTQDIIKKLKKKNKKIRLIIEKTKKTSQGNARNLAVKKAKGKFIAFTDADCVAKKDWLRTLVNSFVFESKINPKIIGIGGSKKPIISKNWKENLIGEILSTYLGSGFSEKKKKEVDSIPNYNSIYLLKILKKEKYSEIGIGEDFELNQRLGKKGFEFIFNPKAIIYHHQEQGFKTFFKKMFNYGKAQVKVYRKIRKIRYFAVLAPLYFISLLFSVILSILIPIFRTISLIILLPYVLTCLFTSIKIYFKTKKAYSLISLFIYPLEHISYSLGVIKEILT